MNGLVIQSSRTSSSSLTCSRVTDFSLLCEANPNTNKIRDNVIINNCFIISNCFPNIIKTNAKDHNILILCFLCGNSYNYYRSNPNAVVRKRNLSQYFSYNIKNLCYA